jgi:hypothetical protein
MSEHKIDKVEVYHEGKDTPVTVSSATPLGGVPKPIERVVVHEANGRTWTIDESTIAGEK